MFGKSRSAFLVWSIGLLVILGPFISDTESLVGHLVARLLITGVLASGVYAVSRRPSHLRIALVLLILTVIGSVTMMLFPTWPVMVANLAMGALFYLMLCLLLIHHILAARHVTADTIYTSIAAYMMLSATFAVLYLLADALQPGAVTGAIHRHPPLPFSILGRFRRHSAGFRHGARPLGAGDVGRPALPGRAHRAPGGHVCELAARAGVRIAFRR